MKFTNTFFTRFLTVVQIITFLVISHMISCKCNQNRDDIPEEKPDESSEQHQVIELSLNRISAEEIEGDQKTISLEIENKGTGATVADQLKLQLTREEGSSAMIQGSSCVGSTNVYLIDLPFILAAKEKKPYHLTIDSKDDKQAKFSIQLQYEGKNVGNAVKVSWEQGVKLELENIDYDRTSGKLYVDISNKGTKKATHVKLIYAAQTPEAQLEGVDTKEIEELGEVDKDDSIKGYDLGKLEFGGANKSAKFTFTLFCAESKSQAIASITKTFIKADIKVSIDVDYDQDKEAVSCRIENTGVDKAEGLQLVYQNTSSDAEGKLAELKLEPGNNLSIGDLGAGQEKDCSFKLALKEADTATFDFKVLYDNNPVSETTEKFQAKPIKLTLKVGTPRENNWGKRTLYGAENEIKLQIKQEKNSRTIDPAHLKLAIQAVPGGIISRKAGESAITELVGPELGNLGEEIKLYVNPTSGVKEANCKFQLKYKDKPLDTPLLVEWREQIINIRKHTHRLIAYQEGSFNLESPTPIQLADLTLVIEGDNGMTFQVCKLSGEWVDGAVKLADVASYAGGGLDYKKTDDKKTVDIKFKIRQHHNKKKTKATIIIKRGTIELAREEVGWVDSGISLSVSTSIPIRGILEDNSTETITIKNNVAFQAIDLNEIRVKLTNTAGSLVTLGKVSGSNIERTLAEVTGQMQLEKDESVDITLKMATLPDGKLAAGIVLELLDDQNGSLDKKLFVYLSKRREEMDKFERILGNLEDFPKKLKLSKDKPGELAQMLEALENGLMNFKILLKNFDEVGRLDSGFQLVLNEGKEIFSGEIEQFERLVGQTQAAIADLASNEEALEKWANQAEKDMQTVQGTIEQAPERVKEMKDNVKAILDFLTLDFKKKLLLDKQGVRASYNFYKQNLEGCKGFLANRGITDFKPVPGDSKSIKQLKEIYNQMAKEFPTITQKAQKAFLAIFEVFDDSTAQIRKMIEDKQINEVGDMLGRQLNNLADLNRDKNLIEKQDNLGLERAVVDKFIAQTFQDIAENTFKLVKVETDDNLQWDVQIASEAAKRVFKIARKSDDKEIKQAARNTLDFAIKAFEEIKRTQGEEYEIFVGTKLTPIKDMIDLLTELTDKLKSLS